jgi:hypothetical protein
MGALVLKSVVDSSAVSLGLSHSVLPMAALAKELETYVNQVSLGLSHSVLPMATSEEMAMAVKTARTATTARKTTASRTASDQSVITASTVPLNLPSDPSAMGGGDAWYGLTPPFAMAKQSQENWCWATVAASVSNYYHNNGSSGFTPCLLANVQLGATTCCFDGSTPQCNQAWYLDRALVETDNYYTYFPRAATQIEVQTEILSSRPLGVRIGWANSGGRGHFVAIDGFSYPSYVLSVQDPESGTSTTLDYNTFLTAYRGTGQWTHSYWTTAGSNPSPPA